MKTTQNKTNEITNEQNTNYKKIGNECAAI